MARSEENQSIQVLPVLDQYCRDADVYRFLKFFTFMDIEEINTLEEEDKNSGKAPRAQYVLAEKVTRLVHGEEGLVAKRITEKLVQRQPE